MILIVCIAVLIVALLVAYRAQKREGYRQYDTLYTQADKLLESQAVLIERRIWSADKRADDAIRDDIVESALRTSAILREMAILVKQYGLRARTDNADRLAMRARIIAGRMEEGEHRWKTSFLPPSAPPAVEQQEPRSQLNPWIAAARKAPLSPFYALPNEDAERPARNRYLRTHRRTTKIYSIVYCDYEGALTERMITLNRIDERDSHLYLTCYCQAVMDERTFRADRIVYLYDHETDSEIADPVAYFEGMAE